MVLGCKATSVLVNIPENILRHSFVLMPLYVVANIFERLKTVFFSRGNIRLPGIEVRRGVLGEYLRRVQNHVF